MRSRRPTPEHQEAVSRRLALLSQELSALGPVDPPPDEPAPQPVGQPVALPGAGPVAGIDPDALGGHTRVRPRWQEATARGPDRPALPAYDAGRAGAVVPVVPAPGRHAARRPRASVALVPEPLRGRVALGTGHLALVAVLVAAGLAATAWWVARGEPRTVAAPVVTAGGPALATPAVVASTGPAAAETATPAEVVVDVAGKVRRPGIVVLEAGARVVDALEAAGGARPGVDLSSLNLARLLVDGEQVLVGMSVPGGSLAGGAAPPVTGGAVGPPGPAGAPVNLNTATAVELDTLPEVGPVTAEAILAWRNEHGGFTAVDELLEVDGIGEATLATIAPHVTV